MRWVGSDAHAYWNAWTGGLYHGSIFGGPDAYLYSPAFAAAIWPLTLLPWPVFLALWLSAAATAFVWLLSPLRPAVRLPLVIACTAISLVGNVEWLLALAVVLGLRRPVWFVVPLLTKVTLGIGVLWFAVRGDWRRLGEVALFAILVVALTGWLPWAAWMRVLIDSASGGYVMGVQIPSIDRALLAVPVLTWGARTGRTWVIPVAMVLVSPNLWLGTFGLLAAVPRLSLTSADAYPVHLPPLTTYDDA